MTKTDKQALRGQILPPRYYLAECQGCGVIMPSNKLVEAVNFPDGDADVHCPHCNADDCDIMDLGTGEEPGAIAWNYQQKRIESLLDELEGGAGRIKELESQRTMAFAACNRWRDKFTEAEKRIAELEARTLTVKLPPASTDDEYFVDGVFQALRYERDVERAILAAGIALDTGE